MAHRADLPQTQLHAVTLLSGHRGAMADPAPRQDIQPVLPTPQQQPGFFGTLGAFIRLWGLP